MLLDVTALHWPIFVVQFASIAGDGGRSSSFFIFILYWVHPPLQGHLSLQSISRSNYTTQNHYNNCRTISKLNVFRLKLENCQLKLSVECNNQGCAVEVFRCKFKNLNLNHQLWQADFLANAKFLLYFPA